MNDNGTVKSLRDGVVIISGLADAGYGEIIKIKSSLDGKEYKAIALDLDEENVSCVLLEGYSAVRENDTATATKELPSIKVNDNILGRVVDCLGEVQDTGFEIESTSDEREMLLDKIAPGVMARQDVFRPLQTGILSIDALIPIGKGQRQLIIGDRQTGKTAVGIDTIINQKDSGTISIYVAIGQKSSKIAQVIRKLKDHKAMDKCIVVTSSASEPAARQYLAAYTGTAIAEYFAEKGQDALVIYDDLSKHANAYRQMSLLLERPAGREAYPGDIFYLHSKILERSVQYSEAKGGGSITALPIIETQAGDISAYIPTNVISITDGQVFLEQGLFNSGQKPAVSVGTSVSRVGGAAQTKAMKSVAGGLKLDLAQYSELVAFSQFGSDLDEATKSKLEKGALNMELLKQEQYSPYDLFTMVSVVFAGNKDLLMDLPKNLLPEFIKRFKQMAVKHDAYAKFDPNSKVEGEIAELITDLILKVKEQVNG